MKLQRNGGSEPRRTRRGKGRQQTSRKAPRRAREPGGAPELQRLVHELQVHQIELEAQNCELQRAQAELEGSRNGYVDLYDSAPVGYADLDQRAIVRQINLTGAGLLGMARRRIIGKPFWLFLGAVDRLKFSEHLRGCWKTSGKQMGKLELRLKREPQVVLHLSTVAVRGPGDEEWICRTVLTDITERKRAEVERSELLLLEQQSRAEAEKERGRFEAVIRQMPAGVVIADAATQEIIFSNEQFNQICGFKGARSEALAKAKIKLLRADGTPYDEKARPIFRALRTGEIISRERASLVRGDGSQAVVEIAAAPIRDRYGEISSAVATIHDITQQQELESQLRAAHDELEARVEQRTAELARAISALKLEADERKEAQEARQRLMRELVTTQEEERRRVSRQLHDEMGQHLTALMLGLKALEAPLKGQPAMDRLRDLEKLSDEIGRQVHRIAFELRPASLDDLGLHTMLLNYMEEWSARFGITVDFHSGGLEKQRLPTEIETTLYRIVQEALTNVVKHAQATNLSFILVRRADHLLAILEDNGKGFEVDAVMKSSATGPHRLGLLGIKERVGLTGGTFQLESSPGMGTTLFIRIPVAPLAQESPTL